MKELAPTCHFKILRKDKIVLILKHILLPHPNIHSLLAICVLGWGQFCLSQNFKLTGRCWFLHCPFGSLGSSLVLLDIGRDLFEIFPKYY